MGIFLIVLLGPIQFLELADFGALSLRPVHLFFLYVLAWLVTCRNSEYYLTVSFRTFWGFFAGYGAYLVSLLLSMLWAVDGGAAVAKFVKFGTYYFACLTAVLVFLRASPNATARGVIWGGLGGSIAFIVSVAYAFSVAGINAATFILDALRSGNFGAFQFSLYGYLNQFFGSGSTAGEATSGLRHATANFLTFVFLLFMVIQPLVRTRGRLQKAISLFVVGMAVTVTVLSFSRSSIAIIGVITLLAWTIQLGQSRFLLQVRRATSALLMGLVVTGLIVVVILASPGLQETLGKLGTMLSDRFTALSNDERLAIYGVAIDKLDVNPLLGFGGGAKVTTFESNFQIHNVFLNAWFEAGILGLVTSIIFFVSLFGYWVRAVWTVIRHPDSWVLPYAPAWVMGLPIMPMVDALQGGDGNFSLAGFFSLSAFFGWVTANRLALWQNAQEATPTTSEVSVPAPAGGLRAT